MNDVQGQHIANSIMSSSGAGGIKFVQGDFIKDELVIRNVAVTSLPENIYSDGEITRPDVVVTAIKARGDIGLGEMLH